MAVITRGKKDACIRKIKYALDQYESAHEGSAATLYRQNSASVRVRILDPKFAKKSKPERHDEVFEFLAQRHNDDTLQEISVLLLLAPREKASSFLSQEIEDPVPSKF